MSHDIVIVNVGNQPRVDIRTIAQRLEVQRSSLLSLLDDYKSDFEQFGLVRFEIEAKPVGQRGGGQLRTAQLTEDQAYLLLTYTKNTAQSRACKIALVQAFRQVRTQEIVPLAPIIPTDPLELALYATLENRREVTALREDVTTITARLDDFPILGKQISTIHKLGQELGAALGNYRRGWGLFNQHFNLASYRDLPGSRFTEARRFLELQIAAYTGQERLVSA